MRASATVFSLSLAAALWVAAAPAKALGFGRIGNTTQLGQPLNFAAAIRLENDESLSRECVSAEVVVGESTLQSGQVRVTLEAGAAANERLVRITTSALIDEPVVTVSVSVGCTSKVTRKFVAFIDPPLINAPQTAAADNSMMVPQRADSQVAPLVSIVEGEKAPVAAPTQTRAAAARPDRPRREGAAPRAVPRSRPVVIARAAADSASAPAAPKAPATKKPPAKRLAAQAPRPAASGPRLELEAAPAVVARAASAAPGVELPVVAAPASAASAATVDDASALLALERERIRLLEEGLARLRSDSQATQQALVTLQARLQAAESERYSNPLVYALAWLSALLALAVGALWWRQSRARGAAQWWAPPVPVAAPAPVARTKGLDFETAPPTTMSGVAPAYEVSMLDSGEISMPAPDLPMTVPAAAALRPAAAVAEPTRELSVEELIDLEQQAEFFVVLGQDEAAIELLMSHVRNDGGISPLPYLKLLEIYKRRGDADAYERIRDRFNRRFNAYAPDWASDLQQGLSLEAYPETVQRLQELWGAPAKAMETLAAALFRRDASDQTYDLPAYRELLFLYAIARDFQEHGVADLGRDVDLLLPMHDDLSAEPIAQLVHSTGFQNSALMTQPLDLDVSLVRTDGDGAMQVSAPTGLERRSSERVGGADSNLIDFDLDLDLDPPAPTPQGSR
ncbi:MAG: hypothetical protein Q8R33_18665 [Burkholderiales bacterium]|nr:hypothetical protein [Burkholderiales bacterium]